MKGPEQQQHHAGGEIRECALKSETNGERCRAQHGDEACGLDAEELKHGNADHRQHAVARDAGDEQGHERIDPVPDVEHARHETLHRAGQVPAGREQDDRVERIQAVQDERDFQCIEIDGHGGSAPDNPEENSWRREMIPSIAVWNTGLAGKPGAADALSRITLRFSRPARYPIYESLCSATGKTHKLRVNPSKRKYSALPNF